MNNLFEQLIAIEAKMADNTLPHSDQQLLDQMWEFLNAQIEELEELELERINAMEFVYEECECSETSSFDIADEI